MALKVSLAFFLFAFYFLFLSSNVLKVSAARKNVNEQYLLAQKNKASAAQRANRYRLYLERSKDTTVPPPPPSPSGSLAQAAESSTSRNNLGGERREAQEINEGAQVQSTGNAQDVIGQIGTITQAWLEQYPHRAAPEPLGYMSILSTLLNLAEENSLPFQQLKKNFHYSKENFKPESIKAAIQELENKGFNWRSVFFRDQSLGGTSQELKNILEKSGIVATDSLESFKSFASTFSGNKIPEIHRSESNNVQTLANVLLFDLHWESSDIDNGERAFFNFGKDSKTVSFLNMTGSFRKVNNDEYGAVEIPLKTANGGVSAESGESSSGLSLYLIDTRDKLLNSRILGSIYKDISEAKKEQLSLKFPSFKFSRKFSVQNRDLVDILVEGSPFYPLLGTLTETSIVSNTDLCISKNGIFGKEVTKFETGKGAEKVDTAHEELNPSLFKGLSKDGEFTRPFYFAIFDEAYGQPLFVTYANDIFSAREAC